MSEFTAKKEYEIPLTKSELAEMLKVSERTIGREVKAGKLKCTLVGGRERFFDHHISEYLRLKEVVPAADETQMAAKAS